MRILRDCPFYDRATMVEVAGERVEVRPYQIIVWVSIRARGAFSRHFPAVLDTGHSLNFSIRDEHLQRWAGIESLPEIGRTTLNQRPVLLYRANLGLQHNARGERDVLRPEFYELDLPEGIVVHSPNDQAAPRLPLLGLRALVRSRLKTVIDGRRLRVSVGHGWF